MPRDPSIGDAIRAELSGAGADVVGFADISAAVADGPLAHLIRAVSIGVQKRLNRASVSELSHLQRICVQRLRMAGYKFLSVPADSDCSGHAPKFVSKLYGGVSHKTAATCAGLGWVGRNGLLINPDFGPRLSLATVLTDAPLDADSPITASKCGDCMLCVEHCPSTAITGGDWSREEPFIKIVDFDRCRLHKSKRPGVAGRPNCGLCINICPYGRGGVADTGLSVLSA